jgi:hypothetical protein
MLPWRVGRHRRLRVPRAHFAAFPWHGTGFMPGVTAGSPAESLLVFYLGVPDTTPEFVDATKLDAYLRERIAQVRRSKPP